VTDHVVIAHGGDVSYPSGGTSRVTAFAGGLADRGYDVTLVAPRPDRELPERLLDVDLSFVPAPTSGVLDEPLRAALVARRAGSVAAANGATVQLEHSTLAGVGQLLGHDGYVLDMHDLAHPSPRYGTLPFGTAVQRAIRGIERRAVQSAAHVVVVSERMRETVLDTWHLDPARVSVIPNGYATADVRPYETAETVAGRVVFLGTLHPKLDTETVFEVAELPPVEEVVVIGDGAKREDLEAGKRERGLEKLKIRGRLPDETAFPILARAAVAINPQVGSPLQEASSPVKLFYYAALGVPMVVSAGPSVAAELGEAGAAEVVEPGGGFPGRVSELLTDGHRREAMGRAATELASRWTWSRRVSTLADLFESGRVTP